MRSKKITADGKDKIMKKSFKKMLTAMLCMVMVASAFTVPTVVSAEGSTTFSVMNDTMDGGIAVWSGTNCNPGSVTNPSSDYDGYRAGTEWGVWWADSILVPKAAAEAAYIAAPKVGSSETVEKNVFKSRKGDVNYVPHDPHSNLVFTYNIKTLTKTEDAHVITASIGNDTYSDNSGFTFFTYDTATNILKYYTWGDQYQFTLAENTDYAVKCELNWISGGDQNAYAYYMTVSDNNGEATIIPQNIKNEGSAPEAATASKQVGCWSAGRDALIGADRMAYITIAAKNNSAEGAATQGEKLLYINSIKVDEVYSGEMIKFAADADYSCSKAVIDTDFSKGRLDGWTNTNENVFAIADDYKKNSGNGQPSTTKTHSKAMTVTFRSNTAGSMLYKKFAPISKGDTLTVSGEIKVYDLAWNSWPDMQIGLSSGVEYYNTSNPSNMRHILRLKSSGYGFEYTTLGKVQYGHWTVDGEQAIDFGTNLPAGQDFKKHIEYIKYKTTLAPKDDTTYTMTTEFDPGYTVLALSIDIPAEEALAMNTVSFLLRDPSNVNDVLEIALKNVKVEVSSPEKTALTAGENKVYLPFDKYDNTPQDMTLIAVVCNKADDMQKTFHITEYSQVSGSGVLSGTVNITDPANEYVRLFVFNNLDTIVPLAESKDINKQ